MEEKIKRMLAEGRSQREIARICGVDRCVVRRVIAGGAAVARVAPAAKPKRDIAGVDLSGVRVAAVKPTVSPIKILIRDLPQGKGFPVPALSESWGHSQDAIERVAKAMGCRKAVEVRPDEWVYLVMEPTTAQKFNK